MNLNGVKAWYQSLTIWGALGTIVVGVLDAIHVAHSATLQNDLNAWSAAAGIVVTGIITIYGRARATKQIGSVSSSTPPQNFKMNSLLLVLSLWLLCIAAGAIVGIAISGCASSQSPRVQWAMARQTLTTTEQTLVAANQAGLLPDKDFVATEPFVTAARAALAQADAELQASNDQPTDRTRYYLSLVQTTLAKLQTSPAIKAAGAGRGSGVGVRVSGQSTINNQH